MTSEQKVKEITALLNECNKESKYKFKVRKSREQYVSTKLYCLTIVGRTHVGLLEEAIQKASKRFWELGGGQIHHTSQHNLKMWFAENMK